MIVFLIIWVTMKRAVGVDICWQQYSWCTLSKKQWTRSSSIESQPKKVVDVVVVVVVIVVVGLLVIVLISVGRPET